MREGDSSGLVNMPGGDLRAFVFEMRYFGDGCGHAVKGLTTSSDIAFMQEALCLARHGMGTVSPNPMVGAIIVKDNAVVGKGYHKRAGTEHAEILALREAGDLAQGATLYVTLEPCAHYGRTPPCVGAIIRSGITRVVVAMEDPNPKVAGKGVSTLLSANLEVRVGVLEEEARMLNEVYVKSVMAGLPFVVLKYAMTMDGKIATYVGDSKWVTEEPARKLVHQLRNTYDAVVVGVGTVLADNPRLTVRGLRDASRNPVRVIIDSYLRTPLDAKVLSEPGKVIIATTKGVPLQRIEEFEDRGVEILAVGEYSNRVDLLVLAQELIKRDITSLLLECGGSLSASFLESGLVDKVLCFIAPKIIGGEGAITPVEGRGIRLMRDCLALQNTSVCKIGQDVLIEGYLKG